ncbi:MAG: hypothetical protein HRF49_02745 [bacterium]
MKRFLVIGTLFVFSFASAAHGQVQDEFTPYINNLTDLLSELDQSFAEASAALNVVEESLDAGAPTESYAYYASSVEEFVALLDRIGRYLVEIDPKLDVWADRFDDFSPNEQERITEVVFLADKLALVYDGYSEAASEALIAYRSRSKEGAGKWRFGFYGEAALGDGDAYGSSQSMTDFKIGASWKRSDGSLIDVSHRYENSHRFLNLATNTTQARQEFPVGAGEVRFFEQYQDVEGLSSAAFDRHEWRYEFDWEQPFGKRGSYFRLRGRWDDRTFEQSESRSYKFNRLNGFIRHEINKQNTADAEWERSKFDYGTGGLLSHVNRNFRIGWETRPGTGFELRNDFYSVDKNYQDSPSLSYDEGAYQIGLKWDANQYLSTDLRYRTLSNDRNDSGNPGNLNDYDEDRFEARVYVKPNPDLNFTLRALTRNKDFTVNDPYELEQNMFSGEAEYWASPRLRVYCENTFDEYDYISDAASFDQFRFRTGFTYSFPDYSNVGLEYTRTDRNFDTSPLRDFVVSGVQGSYNKYWKNVRLRLQGSVEDLDQNDSSSTNIYTTDRLAAEVTYYPSSNYRFSLGTDYLFRDFANQDDIEDWLIWARFAFNY